MTRVPPNGFLTVSKCLGEFVPDDWVYWNSSDRRADRADRAKALGFEIDRLGGFTRWCTEQCKEGLTLGYPNVIFDRQTAELIIDKISELRSHSLTLLGIGLPFHLSGEFFRDLKKVMCGSTELPYGVPTMLQRGLILPERGDCLGFDALSYELHGTFHSSKCYQIEDSNLIGINFNEHGYCATLSEAIKLCEAHSRSSAGEINWLPWKICRYPLSRYDSE